MQASVSNINQLALYLSVRLMIWSFGKKLQLLQLIKYNVLINQMKKLQTITKHRLVSKADHFMSQSLKVSLETDFQFLFYYR